MLSLWREMIIAAARAAAKVLMGSRVIMAIATGNIAIEPIDAADTRREIKTMHRKTARATPHAGAERTAKHPSAVATPLPLGLNLK
jgi:hypothetical protein